MSKFLPDVADITTGKLDANAAVIGGEYPFFTCAPEPSQIDSFVFDEDAVLLAGNNAQGNFHISRYNGKFNAYQRTYVITAKDGYDIDYISYSIEIALSHLKKIAQGSQTKFLTKQILDSFIIADRDLQAQKDIVKILKPIDDKFINNNRELMILEEMVKTIYDYWFVQFDFPDANGRPYKTSGGKMEWNETLSREIPAGWEVGQVCDLGEVIAGGTPSTEHPEYFTSEGIAWITPKDMSLLDGKYIFHGGTDISEEGLKNSSAKLMPAGSVVYTTRAPIGYVAIAGNDVCTNQGFKSVVPKKDFGTEFVYYTLKSLEVHFKNVGNGSTFSEVSKETFSTVPICIPSKEVIINFMGKVDKLSDMQKKAQLENRKLIALRDFLLPMLMNGQVTFRQ